MMQGFQISGIVEESIVDGPGIRYVIFTQGCPHHCPGCHNPETHSFEGGRLADPEAVLRALEENPLLKGVTFSGGEPFCQPEPLADLAEAVHRLGRDVIIYSGYTLEQLLNMDNPAVLRLLDQADLLVDGRFELGQKDLTLRFRGSRNQRVIDMKRTRSEGVLALLE